MKMNKLGRRAIPLSLSLGYVALVGPSITFSAPADANAALVSAHSLLLRGPVDAIDQANSRISVLGQWIHVPPSEINSLPNEIVAIKGALDATGHYRAASVATVSSATQYVPGATTLFIMGRISSIDYAMGTLKIGSLTVDYTAALGALPVSKLSVGAVVSFTGLEYTGISKFYAGMGSAQSVAVSAPVFTVDGRINPFAQTGTGAHTMAQTGTGAHTLAQTGTGAHTMAQTGTGARTMAQTGTGARTMAQTGTGAHTLAQTGTGAHTMAQTGTGAHTLAQTGTGLMGL